MTNGDKIRQMTDEEIAKILNEKPCYRCIYNDPNIEHHGEQCTEGVTKWLQQEAKE